MSTLYPLSLVHTPGAGWDGTHTLMLNAMADILEDGPVEAVLTYWDEATDSSVTVQGRWTGYTPRDGVRFNTSDNVNLRVEPDNIESLSV